MNISELPHAKKFINFCCLCVFCIQGSCAMNLMQYLCSNDVDVPVGRAFQTLMLNPKGGIEAFCSVYRLDEERYTMTC